jgi:hypothetical protein
MMARKSYEEKFERAFAAGMAENAIERVELIEFGGQIAGIFMARAQFRGIPAERAGKLAADLCQPLFEMTRVTA